MIKGLHQWRWWQWVVAAALLLLAVAPRFVNLGDRPVMHDESMFAYYSYTPMLHLQNQGTLVGSYTHMPIMHGPLLELTTAVVFRIFGDSMAIARGLIALSSLGMIIGVLTLWPRRLRWWLAPLIITSPVLLFYSRFFRNDILFCTFLILGVAGVVRGLGRSGVARDLAAVAGITLLFGLLAIMENAVFVYATAATFGCVYLLVGAMRRWAPPLFSRAVAALRPPRVRHPDAKFSTPRRKKKAQYMKPSYAAVVGEEPMPPDGDAASVPAVGTKNIFVNALPWVAGVFCGLTLIAAVYGWLVNQATVEWADSPAKSLATKLGWANLLASWQYWEGQHSEHRISGALHYHLTILFIYELPALLLIYAGLAWDGILRRARWIVYLMAMLIWFLVWILWRLIWPLEAGIVERLLDFLHLEPNGSMLWLGAMIMPLLVWSIFKLIERRHLAAWMGWWAACSMFQYASAGEKVPWLAMHIVLPLYMMLGWVWVPLLRNRKATVKSAFAALALIAAAIGAWHDLRFLGERGGDPRERLVFNHTSYRLDRAIKNQLEVWERDAAQRPLEQRRVLLADDPGLGGPSWPAIWYFRKTSYVLTTAPAGMMSEPWDLVLGTKQVMQPVVETVDRERWQDEEMSLRDHWWAPWPEEVEWGRWRRGEADALGSKPQLLPLVGRTLRQWWRYYWLRETWTEPGGFPIILMTPGN